MRDPNCQLCALGINARKTPKTVCLLPQVKSTCDVMIVAEAPTQVDDMHGRIFVGKQMKEIKDFFEAEGLKVHCTYALKCTKPKEVKINDKMVKACRDGYLAAEIAEVEPKHIITLGANAFKGVTKRGNITEKRGTPQTEDRWPYTVYPTIHQAQAAFNESDKIQLWQDLKLFAKWIKYGVEEVSKFNPPVYVADTLKSLRKLRAKIRKAGGVAAVDIETSGLNPYHPDKHIRSIQFCWDPAFGGVFVPLDVGPGCYYTDSCNKASFWKKEDLKEAIKIIRQILLETKCIWHNGKFDRVWLYEWGRRNFGKPILCPKIHMDTMHVAFLINENRPVGLKRLITSELGYPSYNIADKLTPDLDLLILYSTKDTVASYILAQKYADALNEPGLEKLRRLYLKVIRKVDALYTKIEIEGWPVSVGRAKNVKSMLDDKLSESLDKLHSVLQDYDLTADNKVFSAPIKLANLLFTDLELSPNPDRSVAYTETGGLSTDNDALVHLNKHPFVKELLNFRAISKALSTYATPMLHAAEARGKLTTSYKLARAVTGRTASGKEGKGKTASGMNLQNIPPTYGIKTIIMEEPVCQEDIDDPWWILEVDFGQIELREAGELSKDPTLIWAYQNNIDLHTHRAKRIVGEDVWEAMNPKDRKQARNRAKPVNFGFLYGMSWHKFRMFALTDYGVDFTADEARKLREDFFDDHAGLPKWYGKQERQAERLGYVESLSGRRRHLPNIRLNPESSKEARAKRQEAVRMAINTPVQGFASDLKLMSMIEIDSIIDATYARLIGEIHDSILLKVRKSRIREVAEQCLSVMRHPKLLDDLGITLTVPIEAEAECGPSLGEKKAVDEWEDLKLAA